MPNIVYLLEIVSFFESVRNNSLVKNIVISLKCIMFNKLLKIVLVLNIYSSLFKTKQTP